MPGGRQSRSSCYVAALTLLPAKCRARRQTTLRGRNRRIKLEPVNPPGSAAAEEAGTESAGSGPPLDALRGLLSQSTHHFLGATIEVGDEQWRAASRCPGWSRGHLATHVARNAEAITRLSRWALTGQREEMYNSADQRDADIEAGAGRPGVELQVDLDTTAGRLETAFDELDERQAWAEEVEIRGARQSARLLPLMRLFEVVLHNVDLDIGFEIEDLDDDTTGWLLEFAVLRLQGRGDFPRFDLMAESGRYAIAGTRGANSSAGEAGSDEPVLQVSGPGRRLFGWLTGRCGPEGLTGADGVKLPAFS